MMGLAWEIAKEHLLSFEFEDIIKKVEMEREKREIDNEMEEIIFIREVTTLLPPSWHKEILKNFVTYLISPMRVKLDITHRLIKVSVSILLILSEIFNSVHREALLVIMRIC